MGSNPTPGTCFQRAFVAAKRATLPLATVSPGRVATSTGLFDVEASALHQSARLPALAGRSPLLRLQTDEKLVALIRRGHHGAFEALVQRYQPRLLAFCRHMLGSQEDAEDVLQEVFAASFNAIRADDRPINARPWLYRIARNRCLNHLRRPQAAGQDSMDVFERDGGTTTADTVHKREEFRHIVADVQELPESQRTALLLREIDALSYDQIAEAMDTTVPSVKSLLVRARVALAEASEARLLTCDEVRLELGQVAEGITKSSPPVRRHLKVCERCRTFQGELRSTSKALAAVYPIGPLVILKKLWIAKLGFGRRGRRGRLLGRRCRRRRRRGRRGGLGRRQHHRRWRCRRRRVHARLEGRRRNGRRGDRHRRRRRGQARHDHSVRRPPPAAVALSPPVPAPRRRLAVRTTRQAPLAAAASRPPPGQRSSGPRRGRRSRAGPAPAPVEPRARRRLPSRR